MKARLGLHTVLSYVHTYTEMKGDDHLCFFGRQVIDQARGLAQRRLKSTMSITAHKERFFGSITDELYLQQPLIELLSKAWKSTPTSKGWDHHIVSSASIYETEESRHQSRGETRRNAALSVCMVALHSGMCVWLSSYQVDQ